MWGLIQSTFVSVPVRLNSFDISKTAEGEWCAHNCPSAKSRVPTRIKIVESLCRKEDLSLTLWAEYITQEMNVYICILAMACRGSKSSRASDVWMASRVKL